MEVEKLSALKNGRPLDFALNHKPKCPHCGDDFDINDNEAWSLYSEDDYHTVECASCGNLFDVISRATWKFSTDEQYDD